MQSIVHSGKATVNSSRNFFSQFLTSSSTLNFFSPQLNRHRIVLDTRLYFRSMFASKGQPSQNSQVLVFGAGNFGSCLASHLGDSGHDVYMWARDESVVKHFNTHHRNPIYLRDHQFPTNITAVGPDLPSKEFMAGMDVLLFAIPTQFLRYL